MNERDKTVDLLTEQEIKEIRKYICQSIDIGIKRSSYFKLKLSNLRLKTKRKYGMYVKGEVNPKVWLEQIVFDYSTKRCRYNTQNIYQEAEEYKHICKEFEALSDAGTRTYIEYIDLSGVDFKDFNFINFNNNNLKSFNGIEINPQTIWKKSLRGANMRTVKFIGSFDGVEVSEADFTGSKGAKINPQKIKNKSLYNTKCANVEFIGSFDDVEVSGADFTGSSSDVEMSDANFNGLRSSKASLKKPEHECTSGVRYTDSDNTIKSWIKKIYRKIVKK